MKTRQRHKGFSLNVAGQLLLAVVIVYAVVAAVFSQRFLHHIESEANFAQNTQIPLILSQNRNALKVERLASLVRSIYLVNDRRLERQLMLQTQALSQSFTLDDDARLSKGARKIAAEMKKITVVRQKMRDMGVDQYTPDSFNADLPKIRVDLDQQARKAYQGAMAQADQLGKSLSNGAALLAHTVAKDIETTARETRRSWLLTLTVPVILIGVVLFLVKWHVIRPIRHSIDALEAMGRGQESASTPMPIPLFSELRMIADAVKSYGQAAHELRRVNQTLLALSDEDGLTKLANRRSFERYVGRHFERVATDRTDIALLMIDLDHFKSVNDRFGHIAGDACLRATASIIRAASRDHECHAARFGGEEFVVVFPACDRDAAFARAERIRIEIAAAVIEVNDGESLSVTASIGVATRLCSQAANPDALLASADGALYLAKRSGRNVVRIADDDMDLSQPAAS